MLQENRNKINEIVDSEAVSLPGREMALRMSTKVLSFCLWETTTANQRWGQGLLAPMTRRTAGKEVVADYSDSPT